MINQNKNLSRALPFAVYILFLAGDSYFSSLSNYLGFDSKWLYAIRVFAVIALLIYFWHEYSEFYDRPVVKDLIYAALAGLLVFLIWIMPYPAWATLGNHAKVFNPIQNQNIYVSTLWMSVRIFGAAIIVPIMEELFWRSFVMRWIDNKNFLTLNPDNASLYAFLASSCLFALEHNLWLAGLVAGIVYGALYIVYKNLWIPIFAHAITNGLLGIWVVLTGNWQYW